MHFQKSKLVYGVIFLLAFALLFVVAAFRPVGMDRDSGKYAIDIRSIIETHNYNLSLYEPTFYLIITAANFFSGDPVRWVFAIYAFLGVSLILWAIKKNSPFPILSLILFSCTYFVLHEMTQIRVGVAAAIFLLAIPDIANRNWKAFLAKTALAAFFHYSAIVMAFTYLLGAKFGAGKAREKLFYLLLPIIGILFAVFNVGQILLSSVMNFLPDFLSLKINIYLDLLKTGKFDRIKIFDIQYLALLAIYYFAIANLDKFKNGISTVSFKILGWMFFIFYVLYFIPVIAGRLSEFLAVASIFALPSLVLIVKEKYFMYILIVLGAFLMLYYEIIIRNLIVF
jgi:hypothetical protein